MLKRISLVFMLLLALVGVAGVQAQRTAEPQSMAQYLPADTDLFFAIRTDGAFLDELSGVINSVVAKLPESIQAQAQMLNLKTLIESQVGPLSETGLGDYVAVGISNTAVIYDEDRTNDDEAVFYIAAALSDRAKFEAFIDKMSPNTDKTQVDGVSVYTSDNEDEIRALVLDDVLYLTNQTSTPTGDTLADVSVFSETLSNLPEDSYNFLMYADFGPLFEMAMAQMPAESLDVFGAMGLDLSEFGPIVVGGTVLDEKTLVIDSYAPAFAAAMMPMTSAVDPAFASNIPSGFSFVLHGTDLKTNINASLDLVYQINEQQPNSQQMPSREQINEQLKAAVGLDLDNDILSWMGGDYALIADLDMMAVLDAVEGGNMRDLTLDPRFAFVVEGDGSENPAKVVQVLGNLLVNQTKNMQEAPKINLTTEEGFTTVIIEDVPLSQNPEILLDIEMAGNGEFFVVGDQATVEAILSGEGDRLTGDASFVEAAQYILPNSTSIAYAGGDGWGDLFTLGALLGIASSSSTNNNDTQMMIDVLRSVYDIVGSSSASAAYNEDGSQNSRLVLTLK